jgi:hypothetical protein
VDSSRDNKNITDINSRRETKNSMDASKSRDANNSTGNCKDDRNWGRYQKLHGVERYQQLYANM